MKDNLSIVISMVIFVILIVIFPLYNYFERQDDMSYNLALKTTTNFVDEVTEAGYLDQDAYNRFVEELSDTGNVYDIQLEAHRKVLTEDKENNSTYNEQYLIDYNDQIFSTAENKIKTNLNEKTIKDNAYYFNEGDQFYVKLKNSNTTMAGAIFNTIVPSSKKDRIVVNYGGIIKNQAWAKVDATYRDIGAIQTNKPSISLTAIESSGGSRQNKDQKINSEQPIDIYPSNQYFCFSANGPDVKNWWNNISGYIWSYTYTDNAGNVINSTPSSKRVGEEYKFNSNAAEGVYSFSVKAQDTVGNMSDPFEFQIKVGKQIVGSTGEGGFTSKQMLDITTNEFLNAYPKELDLTVYLGSSGHVYADDYIKIYGISATGTESLILYKKISELAGASSDTVTNKTMKIGKITSECNISSLTSYKYKDRSFSNVIKINTKFKNINPSNEYKKIRIIYYNAHPGCVLNISDTVGGAYEYKLEYSN